MTYYTRYQKKKMQKHKNAILKIQRLYRSYKFTQMIRLCLIFKDLCEQNSLSLKNYFNNNTRYFDHLKFRKKLYLTYMMQNTSTT
jgi:hypothetical protein